MGQRIGNKRLRPKKFTKSKLGGAGFEPERLSGLLAYIYLKFRVQLGKG